ncbi:MAG: DUF533 domain-containing protein [Pirellulaceae bacterium]|nr:tellurite resistance TerB family protein [Planctomycetales bacterium]
MDAMDILGGLLGSKSGGGGLGAKILRDILAGGRSSGGQAPQQPSSPSSRTTSSGPPRGSRFDTDRSARDLEDLLNVAQDRHHQRTGQPRTHPPAAPPRPAPSPPSRGGNPFGRASENTGRTYEHDQLDENDRAVVLIRAMVNASKADGQISQDEQQKILNQLGGATQEVVQFLREEFARPLDVREFAWSVPLGMEEQVYTLSLVAIDLDTNPEAAYLAELAHGLRIPRDVRDALHQRVGAPTLR